jgi:hypothetical protein
MALVAPTMATTSLRCAQTWSAELWQLCDRGCNDTAPLESTHDQEDFRSLASRPGCRRVPRGAAVCADYCIAVGAGKRSREPRARAAGDHQNAWRTRVALLLTAMQAPQTLVPALPQRTSCKRADRAGPGFRKFLRQRACAEPQSACSEVVPGEHAGRTGGARALLARSLRQLVTRSGKVGGRFTCPRAETMPSRQSGSWSKRYPVTTRPWPPRPDDAHGDERGRGGGAARSSSG